MRVSTIRAAEPIQGRRSSHDWDFDSECCLAMSGCLGLLRIPCQTLLPSRYKWPRFTVHLRASLIFANNRSSPCARCLAALRALSRWGFS